MDRKSTKTMSLDFSTYIEGAAHKSLTSTDNKVPEKPFWGRFSSTFKAIDGPPMLRKIGFKI